MRTLVSPPLKDDELTAEELQILGDVAAARRRFRFSRRQETWFRRDERLAARVTRTLLCMIPVLSFGTAPLWQGRVTNTPDSIEAMLVAIELLVIAPMFLMVAWLQWRRVESDVAEMMLIASFLIVIACIELIRYQGAEVGHVVEPYLAATIPVAVVTLARLSIPRCIGFMLGYVGIIAMWAWFDSREVPARSVQEWILESLLLSIALLSAIVTKIVTRRQWASGRLLQSMAFRDPLTGLANRRALEERFELASRAVYRGNQRRLFFALLDMDHFKKVNDVYGHEYGDGVLAEFALVFAEFARRPMDLAARLGGDEFALLLYDCDQDRGAERLEQLLQAVRDLMIEHRDNRAAIVTCSAGGVSIPAGQALADAYRGADRCLYEAKHAGRDCAVVDRLD